MSERKNEQVGQLSRRLMALLLSATRHGAQSVLRLGIKATRLHHTLVGPVSPSPLHRYNPSTNPEYSISFTSQSILVPAPSSDRSPPRLSLDFRTSVSLDSKSRSHYSIDRQLVREMAASDPALIVAQAFKSRKSCCICHWKG